MTNKYYKCQNCKEVQVNTEFGECAECGYEDLLKISEEEYNES